MRLAKVIVATMTCHDPFKHGAAMQVDQLRKEVEIISQTHERDVDRKDAFIQVRRPFPGGVTSS